VSPPALTLGHRPSLDGLRGVAILAVLGLHAQLPFFHGGFVGVDVFFVLSGFLITVLLLEEWRGRGTIGLGRFYLRRALRLLPALLVLVGAAIAWELVVRPADPLITGATVAAVLLYVANWAAAFGAELGAFAPTWSLALEEQFYLVWPLALLWLLRRRVSPRGVIALLVVGIVAVAVNRACLFTWGHDVRALYVRSDTRADTLLFGALAGVLVAWGLLPRSPAFLRGLRVAATVGALVLLLLATHLGMRRAFYYYGGFDLVAACAAVVVVALVMAPPRWLHAVLSLRPLVGIGRLSYALYLWHWPVFWVLQERFDATAAQVRWPALAVSFACATLSYYLVERPALRRKARLAWSA
jgi:peptidoglycan/LPS O-acetylase OafA/YrhL